MRSYVVLILSLVLCTLAAGSAGLASAQVREKKDGLARVQDRPQLAVQLPSVAKLKIDSRKRGYRIGELLTLDVALLNTSIEPTYFPQVASGRTFFKDQIGREKSNTAYIEPDTMPMAQSYRRLGTNEISFTTIHLMIGCNPQAFAQARAQFRSFAQGKKVFDENLFVSWGESCLDITRPGIYTLSFELSNLLVVVSPDKSNSLTGTGRLKSNNLALTISK